MVHGSHEVVNAICDHPDIKAVSFVGSNAAGKHIYTRATAAGKRVQANTGAKNHAVVMPDADVEHAAKALVGAAFGAAGQRCMAISAIVVVGDPTRFEHALSEAARQLVVLSLHALSLARLVVSPSGHAYSVAIRRAHVRSRLRTSSVEVQQANHPSFIWTLFIWTSSSAPILRSHCIVSQGQSQLQVGAGCEADTDVGPVISESAKHRIESLIQSGVDEGGRLVMGGQRPEVPGYPDGVLPRFILCSWPGSQSLWRYQLPGVLQATLCHLQFWQMSQQI